MPKHIRKDDTVIVTCGREEDRGRTGKVLKVFPKEDRVLVEGINIRRKTVKPTQENQQGGVISKEMPIHISNVSPVVDGKPTRVRFETRADGSKIRVAVRNGQQIGPELRRAKK